VQVPTISVHSISAGGGGRVVVTPPDWLQVYKKKLKKGRVVVALEGLRVDKRLGLRVEGFRV